MVYKTPVGISPPTAFNCYNNIPIDETGTWISLFILIAHLSASCSLCIASQKLSVLNNLCRTPSHFYIIHNNE